MTKRTLVIGRLGVLCGLIGLILLLATSGIVRLIGMGMALVFVVIAISTSLQLHRERRRRGRHPGS
jgi:hypothetical protein